MPIYGIDPKLIQKAKQYIPDDFIRILNNAYRKNEDIERWIIIKSCLKFIVQKKEKSRREG